MVKKLASVINDSRIQLFLVFFFLCPLFFMNILEKHDWGGDFAQYIQQALNIIDGKAQNDTHYIFNPHNPYLAPPAYPVGFPIILAPIAGLFGNSIIAFSYYITAFFVLLLLVVFHYLRDSFSFIIALVATLIFAYNPHMIILKGEIISDIPFTVFFLVCSLIYIQHRTRNNWWIWFGLGLLVGFTMLIRSVGFILVFGIALDLFNNWLKNENRTIDKLKTPAKNLGLLLIGMLLMYSLIAYIILPVSDDNYKFYTSLFSFSDLGNTYSMTSEYYIKTLQNFFQYEKGAWAFASLITKAFVLVFFLIGLFSKGIRNFKFVEYITLMYLLIILSFPNATQGFRYLLPIFPFIIYYFISGIQRIKLDYKLNPNVSIILIFGFFAIQYKPAIHHITEKPYVWFGPQHPDSMHTFEFIRRNTDPKARFVFEKPRVLGLYTSRDSYNINKRDSITSTADQINELGFDFILTSEDIKNDSLERYIEINHRKLNLIYSHGMMKLYSKLD